MTTPTPGPVLMSTVPQTDDTVPQNLSALLWALFKRYGLQILPTLLCLLLIWWSRQDHLAEIARSERWLMVVEAQATAVRENSQALKQHMADSGEADRELLRVMIADCINQAGRDMTAQRRCQGLER